MLLFDIIRDWFVMYIWGGLASNGEYFYARIGELAREDLNYAVLDTQNFCLPIKDVFTSYNDSFGKGYISLGDWLSTTSAIIVMILLCIVFGLMVRWLFRLTSGLLQGKC